MIWRHHVSSYRLVLADAEVECEKCGRKINVSQEAWQTSSSNPLNYRYLSPSCFRRLSRWRGLHHCGECRFFDGSNNFCIKEQVKTAATDAACYNFRERPGQVAPQLQVHVQDEEHKAEGTVSPSGRRSQMDRVCVVLQSVIAHPTWAPARTLAYAGTNYTLLKYLIQNGFVQRKCKGRRTCTLTVTDKGHELLNLHHVIEKFFPAPRELEERERPAE